MTNVPRASRSSWTRGLALLSVACLLASVAIFHTSATAQSGSKAPPVTAVAVVDVNGVLDGLAEREQIFARLLAEQQQRQKLLDEVTSRLQAAEKRMGDLAESRITERQQLAGEIVELQGQVRIRKEVLERLGDLDLGREMWALYTKINDAVSRTAQQQGFDLVISDDSRINIPAGRQLTGTEVRKITTERQILYAGPKVDLTQQVITMMNNEFEARAGRR
jgi:Skp family chaperone for outer membrane proteins